MAKNTDKQNTGAKNVIEFLGESYEVKMDSVFGKSQSVLIPSGRSSHKSVKPDIAYQEALKLALKSNEYRKRETERINKIQALSPDAKKKAIANIGTGLSIRNAKFVRNALTKNNSLAKLSASDLAKKVIAEMGKKDAATA